MELFEFQKPHKSDKLINIQFSDSSESEEKRIYAFFYNDTVTIKYNLQRPTNIHLKIYNLAGQEITTLISGYQVAGEHQIKWTAEGLPSGIYFYRLKAGDFSETKKLILHK